MHLAPLRRIVYVICLVTLTVAWVVIVPRLVVASILTVPASTLTELGTLSVTTAVALVPAVSSIVGLSSVRFQAVTGAPAGSVALAGSVAVPVKPPLGLRVRVTAFDVASSVEIAVRSAVTSTLGVGLGFDPVPGPGSDGW